MNFQATLWTALAALKVLHNTTLADCSRNTVTSIINTTNYGYKTKISLVKW